MTRFFKYGLLILLVSFTTISNAQLSPGKLSKAHAELEGISNCTQCHTLGKQITNQKCLECHKEISSLIDEQRGYHASEEVQGESCAKCHSEHHGLKFDATKFDEEGFDHLLTGYELEGQHAVIECLDCHKPEFIVSPEIRKLENTFLGMEQQCVSCHEDFHQETLSNECINCHGFNEWRPASGFDHNEAAFVLKGAHQEVDCKECHEMTELNGKDFQVFTGLEFSQCIDCHEDVHKGKFGTNCLECHTENSFSMTSAPANFDHSLTAYPLEGLHIDVACKSCHTSGKYTEPLAFDQCKDCHEDYHQGEFVKNSVAPDCKECHTLDQRFDFTLYGLEQHNASQFSLEGAHMATPCFACHLDEQEEHWSFRSIGEACVDCHDNIHKGKITADFYPEENCTVCHNTERWLQVTFDHNTTDWALEGKHEEVDCRTCHFREETLPDFGQQFADLNTDCVTCHENAHGTQFGEPGTFSCTKCHTTAQEWNANNFDHNETDFPLEGQHADVDCKECHKPVIIDGETQTEYKLKSFACIDCHS